MDTIVQNWDTYGSMSHNYYLYNDPTSNTLTWIPWDNNMALSSQGKMGKTKSFDQQGVNENWPLISFLIADPVYYQIYTDYLVGLLTIHLPRMNYHQISSFIMI